MASPAAAAPEAAAAPARPDEDCLRAQYDECLSISLIFPDEFRLLSGLATTSTSADDDTIVKEEEEATNTNKNEGESSSSATACTDLTLLSPDDLAHPISFSVRLRPVDDATEGDENDGVDNNDQLWPSDSSFALVISYPPSYPEVPPTFSFSSAALHPIQEEACLTAILTDIRPDLDAKNPCALTAIASARQFFLNGGLVTGLLHSIDEDALATILAYLATDVEAVESCCVALPIFDVVGKRNEVWKPLCQRRWRTKWGYEKRWRVALAEEKEFHKNHHLDAASTMGTWWYGRYMWQEEDAKRDAITVEELTDPSAVWDVRNFFERPTRDRPEYMRDVRMSGLRRSVEMLQFVRLHHHGADADHLPKNMPKDKGHSAGPIRRSDGSDDDLATSWCWCLKKEQQNDSNNIHRQGQRPQIVSMYSREVAHTGSGIGIHSEVIRLDTWGWEIRNVQRVFRCIDVSSIPVSDGTVDEKSWDAKVAEARTRLDGLWSDYLENLITEEKPVWVKPEKKHGASRSDLNFREVPDNDDLKAFLPW